MTQKTFDDVILLFGGSVVDPMTHNETIAAFGEYLDQSGVRHFTARELCFPHRIEIAHKLGIYTFLPERLWWPRGAALALLADKIRDHLGEPVRCRNWYRPPEYNAVVGGAKRSDHLTAHAFDLDYRSGSARTKAADLLDELDRDYPWLALSIGTGAAFHHVGIMSPMGRRRWAYNTRGD